MSIVSQSHSIFRRSEISFRIDSARCKKDSESSGEFSDRSRTGRILLAMTKAQRRANWSGAPSPIHLWMEALLRVAAMLWSIVAATFQMDPSRRARECDTPPAPQALPRRTRDPIEETETAEPASHETTEALMPRAGEAGASKREGGLAAAGHTLAHPGECHPGSAQPILRQGWPGPIPRHRDSQTHGSRLSSAHALAVGMTLVAVARFRSQDSRAPS